MNTTHKSENSLMKFLKTHYLTKTNLSKQKKSGAVHYCLVETFI
jgi:hypothetical protein